MPLVLLVVAVSPRLLTALTLILEVHHEKASHHVFRFGRCHWVRASAKGKSDQSGDRAAVTGPAHLLHRFAFGHGRQLRAGEKRCANVGGLH